MGWWKTYKKGVRQRWNGMTGQTPTNTGDGEHIDHIDMAVWNPIYEKFRARMGRDPYSFRELRDWWNQY